MKFILTLLALASLTLPTYAQLGDNGEEAVTGDPRVRSLLDQLQFEYTVTSSGAFKLVLPADSNGERTQLVMINSKTETLGKFEIREVWAPAYQSDGPLPRDVANKLLINSFDQKLGAWQTMQVEDSYLAVYAIKLAANADLDALRTSILICMRTADRLESELTNADKY